MNRARNIKQGLVLLSLPFVLLLFYNNNSNWHYHQQQNGTLVRHAHPYAAEQLPGTPVQEHPHSNVEWLVLTLVSSAYTDLPLFAAEVPAPAVQDSLQSAGEECVAVLSEQTLLFFRRGPPLAA